jgi:molybdopterin converting factor small subunit
LKIEVRLFATLRNGRDKKVTLDCDEHDTTPRHLMKKLEILLEEVAILLINGRDGSWDQPLQPGDYLSVFPPVGGG